MTTIHASMKRGHYLSAAMYVCQVCMRVEGSAATVWPTAALSVLSVDFSRHELFPIFAAFLSARGGIENAA